MKRTTFGWSESRSLMDRIKTFVGDLLRPAEAPSSFEALLGDDRHAFDREEILSIPPEDPYNLVYWVKPSAMQPHSWL
jgi:hypothetical protein